MVDNIKNRIIESYLTHQLSASMGGGSQGPDYDAMSETSNVIDIPDSTSLQEFKAQVRAWIETDNVIKKLQQAMKDKIKVKKELTQKILNFMSKYNIEDLNTKDGKLRYKVAYVRAPLSQKTIKQKMLEYYDPHKSGDELSKMIFDTREKIPKPTLRRVQIQNT